MTSIARAVEREMAGGRTKALSLETMRNAKGEVYRIAQIGFAGDAELRAALRLPEGTALSADAKTIEKLSR